MVSKLFNDLCKCQKIHEVKNDCDLRFTCEGCKGKEFCDKYQDVLWDMQSILIKKGVELKRL